MSKQVEIKYFNSFILRKAIASVTGDAVYAGDPSNPEFYPAFPIEASTTASDVEHDWFVEESRIRAEFSGNEVDLAVRAYLEDEEVEFNILKNSIIYSGVVNQRTNVNQSNVFSVGEDITRSVDPRSGGIEFLYSDDNYLYIFQENKVARALIDKDAIYSAEGRPIQSRSDLVIGDIQYYAGDYGISQNPESFASDGNRRYFADVNNGSIMRLSNDGLTEISKYGMEDYFRDELQQISNEAKRVIVDVTWTPVAGNLTALTVGGDNIDSIELGMAIEGIVGYPSLYVTDIGTPSGGTVSITLSQTINVGGTTQPNVLNLVKYVRDKVIGGYDDNYENYVVSIVYNPPQRTAEGDLVTLEPELEPIPLPD